MKVKTDKCSCSPPRKVAAIGLIFEAGVHYVFEHDPFCPIHGEKDGRLQHYTVPGEV